MVASLLALVFGSVYYQQDYSTTADCYSRIAVMNISMMFMGIICTMTSLPIMSVERAVYYRERAANMYTAKAYAMSVGVVEIPYLVMISGVFVTIFYFIIGFQNEYDHFLYYWLYLFLYITEATFLGQFLVVFLPNQQTAQIVAALTSNVFNLFAGFLKAPDLLPQGLTFFYWIDPLHYAFEGLVVTQFAGDLTVVTDSTNPSITMTAQDFAKSMYPDFTYGHRFTCIFVLLGIIMTLRAATLYALTYVNHLTR